MKITLGASSIVSFMCFFLLVGCENIYVPNFFGEDEVPDEVKDQPRFVEIQISPEEENIWPRLGDVPFKPKDFTSKTAYDQSMSELEKSGQEAAAVRKLAVETNPAFTNAAAQDKNRPLPLQPPQFIIK